MDEHTPAPLKCAGMGCGNLVGSLSRPIAVFGHYNSEDPVDHANARRFVALWHASEGIPTDQLEAAAGETEPADRLWWLAYYAEEAARKHLVEKS